MTDRHESGLSIVLRQYVEVRKLEDSDPKIKMGAIKRELSGWLKNVGLRVNGEPPIVGDLPNSKPGITK